MKKEIVKDFRGTNLVFSKSEQIDSIDVVWKVYFNDVEFNYYVGTIQAKGKLLDKQIELYAMEFMNTITFHKTMLKVATNLKKSKDRMERDYMTNFCESYANDMSKILIKLV